MRGYANGIELNRILVDAEAAVNIMPLKTVHSLFLMPYMQDARGVTIAGFNQATEEALGRVEIDLVLGEFAAKVTFYVVETNTSFKALLGRPWIHQNWVIPSTLHQCVKYARNGEQHRVFADLEPFKPNECHLADAHLYFENTLEASSNKADSKGKQKIDQISDEADGISVNQAKAAAYRQRLSKNSARNVAKFERPVIDLEANTISRILSSGIPRPPGFLQLIPGRETHKVEPLKTVIVPHKNGRKIVFHKGGMIPKAPSGEIKTQVTEQEAGDTILDLQDMPEHIKKMCAKQHIPNRQTAQREKFFQDLWYPTEVRGQPPFPRKDKRGLGYGRRSEPTAYYAVNTVSLTSAGSDSDQLAEACFDSSEGEEEQILLLPSIGVAGEELLAAKQSGNSLIALPGPMADTSAQDILLSNPMA